MRGNGRCIDLRAFNLGAAVLWKSEDYFVEGRNGSVAEPLPGEGLRHAEPYDDSIDFIGSEHEGCKLEGPFEAIPYPCLAHYGYAGKRNIADVAIDGSLGDGEELSQLRGGSEPPRSKVLHDLKEPVRTAHAATLSGSGEQAHPVAFRIPELRIKPYPWQWGSR